MTQRYKVLIVDDSPIMQSMIALILKEDPSLQIVGTAADPFEARDQIKALNPDAITLDLEMPNMNGLEFLKRIMKLRPMPVVVISGHATEGSPVASEAFRLGANACLPKPNLSDEQAMQTMRQAVRDACLMGVAKGDKAKPHLASAKPAPTAAPKASNGSAPDIIALGSSTGGIEALEAILGDFAADCPPTVITQHLPGRFSNGLAARLDRAIQPHLKVAEDGETLKTGCVYLAPGEVGHLHIRGRSALTCHIVEGDPVQGHRPAVDEMFRSLAALSNFSISAAVLTGMGADGAQGLLSLRQAGARTFAQDQATSLVYGMPRVAAECGAAQQVLPLQALADALQGRQAMKKVVNQ
ncbi:chemotaxis-specific protein-glutamate methyltransferase CheB [Notoacmeibacter sp. MSK16QG-6]|uniref:chemotaxis-specific protein-glutamate methyltransferase CheB n=1 Tax=Notoacmeibacter sp. MSK16QG-6 TaxID=2957982 RepID=UPI00209E9DC8|nr:chemotaxis-specific protein-glutamate methyltransferase CheB [Notoacmeibacter sp. MSK16QG-6]MCP1200894.1 chemotaxis-specific protein-glutamate methyltransferase CheB [Notoacmeibacter sp. MSK16QG-6]